MTDDDFGFDPGDTEVARRLGSSAPPAGDADAVLAGLRPRLTRARRRRQAGFVAIGTAVVVLLAGVAFAAIGPATDSNVRIPPADRPTVPVDSIPSPTVPTVPTTADGRPPTTTTPSPAASPSTPAAPPATTTAGSPPTTVDDHGANRGPGSTNSGPGSGSSGTGSSGSGSSGTG